MNKTEHSAAFPLIKGARGMITKLIIYDILGREVAVLFNKRPNDSTYEVQWDGSNFPSGVYFYRIVAGDFIETRKMVMVK